jgi:hypothetical protein
MIDTDALRAGVEEMIAHGDTWIKRDDQERLAFKRLPGLISLLLDHAGPAAPERVSSAIERSGLFLRLHELGRHDQDTDAALETGEHLMNLVMPGTSNAWTTSSAATARSSAPPASARSALSNRDRRLHHHSAHP